jgi:hypothetical protein
VQARADFWFDDDAVNNDVNPVLLISVKLQLQGFVNGHHLPINPDANEPLPANFFKQVPVSPFATANDWGEDMDASAFGQTQDLVNDLLWRLADNGTTALVAVRCPNPSEQKSQVVVNLGHCGDS